MRKHDLSKKQLRDLKIFNLLLECDGWLDTEGIEERLTKGESLNPEGIRTNKNGQALLQACFHAPLNMISLHITDLRSDRKVLFHFFYDNRPERILEWLTSSREELSLSTYPRLLLQMAGRCEMILLELSETELYEIKPPANETSAQSF